MENELEFYRTQRIRVLNLISDLNKELLLIKLDFVMGSTTSEEFVKERDSIISRINVAKEVDAELLENIVAITDSLNAIDDCELDL